VKPSRAFLALIRLAPGQYSANVALQLFRSLTQLLPGLVAYVVFNQLNSNHPVNGDLWSLSALLVGFTIARITFLLFNVRSDAAIGASSSSLLMRNFLRCALAKPGAVPMKYASGEMVSRLSADTEAVSDAIVENLIMLGVVAQALVAIVLMFVISPQITLVVILPLAAAGFLTHLASNRIKNYYRDSRQAAGAVSGFLGDVFSGVLTIQSAGAQSAVLARYNSLNEERRRSSLQSRLFTNVFMLSVYMNVSNFGVGLVLVLAAQGMRDGAFSVGALALFTSYLGWISNFTSLLGTNLALYKQGAVSLNRLAEGLPDGCSLGDLVSRAAIAAGPTVPAAGQSAPQPPHRLETLEVRGLTYTFPSSGRGITGVTFKMQRGDFVVITGRVGAGKTTLLRAILGLLPARAGTIWWNGTEVACPSDFFVPPRSAYTPQVPRLASDSLEDNILLGLTASRNDLDEALCDSVMEADIPYLEDRLATLVGPRGTKLSGGQIQRAATARAFIRHPELLVFDDLSSALDVNTEAELWRRMSGRRDQTCLLVSHRRAALEQATLIIVLEDGRVEAQGSLAEIAGSSRVLRHLWSSDIR
jgi:ATP-binding cassette, subfamily B, bacterial